MLTPTHSNCNSHLLSPPVGDFAEIQNGRMGKKMEELEERITVVESTNTEGQAQCTGHTETASRI